MIIKKEQFFKDYKAKDKKRNFILFAFHLAFLRLGWLFKTESIIISSFVRLLGASNFIVGLLPMVSRLGQTLPQFFVANQIQHLPRKKPVMVASHFLYSFLWLLMFLVIMFIPHQNEMRILPLFFAIYIIFWLNSGAYRVSNSLLKGKLIPYNIRGRLLSITGIVGGIGSLVFIFLFILPLLKNTQIAPLAPYRIFFLFSTIFFFLSWIFILFLKEPSFSNQDSRQTLKSFTKDSFSILKKDKNLILTLVVGCVITAAFSLIYFYAGYAKTHLKIPTFMLSYYLACQISANTLGSLFYGFLVDRYGNRLGIRISTVFLVLTPCMAVFIAAFPGIPFRAWFYCIVFFLVGFNLPIHSIMTNYILEISPLEKHPNYLGVYNALRSIVLVFPPLIGFLMDRFYYNRVFLGTALFLSVGIILSFKLAEPRYAVKKEEYKKEILLG